MNRRDFLRGVAAAGAVCAAGSLSAWADADTDVRTVYLVNKCHLDLGYTNFQHKILRTYFDDFIPRAIDTSRKLAETGASERYCWTLGSWMIQEYLAQASPSAAKRFEQAIADGQIAWHALPFTWQTEMLDRSLIETSLGISKALDKRFGKTTTAGKLTDVMGHSRGIIAPLVDAGVSFLHIGPNGSCRYPDFPAPFFRWRDKAGNELIVMYATDYGGTERLPGSQIAVSMNVRADNTGPHTVQELKDHYAWLKSRYPNAQIISGDLSAAGNALQPYLSSLPVVTQEFGDSWIYGVASDPKKVANYRELCRLRQEWIASGKMTKGAAVDLAMTSRLILGPEHNWGLSFHQIFPWNDLYTPTQLRDASVRIGFQQVQDSWAEKREAVNSALTTLPGPLKAEAEKRLGALTPALPDFKGLTAWDGSETVQNDRLALKIDPKTGAIVSLKNLKSAREWASPDQPLADFGYQTFSKQDFDRFTAAYLRSYSPDLDKPGLENFDYSARQWSTRVKALRRGRTSAGQRILIELAPPENPLQPLALVGMPKQVILEITLPDHGAEIQIVCQCFGKAPNRLPEALWLSFAPRISDPEGWTLEKVNQPVSPLDVIPNSNRRQHAVTREVSYQDATGSFTLETLDAPLVTVGARSLLDFTNTQPDMHGGVHINLHNNLYGTAFPQWYGENMRFRFTLRIA